MKLRNLESVNVSEIKEKIVLNRVDYNLPSIIIKGKKELDDFKIRMSLPTIKYLLKHKSKIVLISHFKDPWKELNQTQLKDKDITVFKKEFSLKPVSKYLEKALKQKIKFIDDCIGDKVKEEIQKMKPREIVILENLRFYSGETKNSLDFALSLSQLGDFYVNDAFGVSHRKHSSIDGLPKYLPSAAGFLLSKEVQALSSITDNYQQPLIVVLGGTKIKTKIKLIKNFLKICDYLLVGGVLANDILRAKNMMKGNYSNRIASLILDSKKIVLPIDMAVLEKINKKNLAFDKNLVVHFAHNQYKFKIKTLKQIKTTDLVLDIGPESQKIFKQKILLAKTIFWNGPLGMIEKELFSKGTKEIALAIAQNNSLNILGGGETSSFVIQNNLKNGFNHISTGGGAMLFFLSREKREKIKII